MYLFCWGPGLRAHISQRGEHKATHTPGRWGWSWAWESVPRKRSHKHQYNREKTGVTAHRGGSVWKRRAGCHFKSQSRAHHQQHGTTSPPTWVPSPGLWLTCYYGERGAGNTGYLVVSVLLRSTVRNVELSKPFCPSRPLAGWKYWRLSSWNNAGMGEGRGGEHSFTRRQGLNKGEAADSPSRVWSLGSPLKGRKRKCLPAWQTPPLVFSKGNDVLLYIRISLRGRASNGKYF